MKICFFFKAIVCLFRVKLNINLFAAHISIVILLKTALLLHKKVIRQTTSSPLLLVISHAAKSTSDIDEINTAENTNAKTDIVK